MVLTKKQLWTNVTLFVVYIIISVLTFLVTKDFLHIFLIWNLFLAALPFGIVYALDHQWVKSKTLIALLLFLWLIFFPNAIYIITDLIYLDVNHFVVNIGSYFGAVIYVETLPDYLALFHLFLGAFLGFVYGLKSLDVLIVLSMKQSFKLNRHLLVFGIFVLSSIAIYIGRFFRYNSWDILRFWRILSDLVNQFSWFTLFFIAGLTLLQLIIFYALHNNFSEEKKSQSE